VDTDERGHWLGIKILADPMSVSIGAMGPIK
jgi:hypothetical protein